MITVYVDVANELSGAKNISLVQLRSDYTKAILDDPTVDFSKINGYFLTYDKNNKEYHVAFNAEKYNQYIKKKEKEIAVEKGNNLLKNIQVDLALQYASDQDAYVMRFLYDLWTKDTLYKVGDRRLYKDILYKCKQEHISQEQHTPDLIPAIWDIINGETEKGTKDNPIPVPEVVSSMVYVKGKYYIESGIIYLMNRDGMKNGDEISLTYKPSQLVGHYFEIVN